MQHPSFRLARWVLGHFVPERDLEAIVGDLAEECALRSHPDAPAKVSVWYWQQILTSIAPLLWHAARRGAWLVTFGVAMGAFIAIEVVNRSADLLIPKLLLRGTMSYMVVSMLFGIGTTVLAGYLAARIRRGAAVTLAAIILVTALTYLSAFEHDFEPWRQLIFVAAWTVAPLLGAALLRRREAAR